MSKPDELKCGTFNKSNELVELENVIKIGNPHLIKGKISVDWLAIIAHYKTQTGTVEIITNRTFARASAWTFTIPPIKKLLNKYTNDGVWADPYAGYNSPATITNDLDPEAPTTHHLEAKDFAEQLTDNSLDGVLFDPPYSYRQISEHYKSYGKTATAKDTSYNFYHRTMLELHPKIKVGGIVISFGWNSNGFPKKWGYTPVEYLLIAHGLHHNDTIVTVQRKEQ